MKYLPIEPDAPASFGQRELRTIAEEGRTLDGQEFYDDHLEGWKEHQAQDNEYLEDWNNSGHIGIHHSAGKLSTSLLHSGCKATQIRQEKSTMASSHEVLRPNHFRNLSMFSDCNYSDVRQGIVGSKYNKEPAMKKKPTTTPSRFYSEDVLFPQILSGPRLQKPIYGKQRLQGMSQSFTGYTHMAYSENHTSNHDDVDSSQYWSGKTGQNTSSTQSKTCQSGLDQSGVGGKRRQQPIICTSDFEIDLEKVSNSLTKDLRNRQDDFNDQKHPK